MGEAGRGFAAYFVFLKRTSLSQGFTLHPTDEDLSAGTPGLGYYLSLREG
jgi:hypothetical protein